MYDHHCAFINNCLGSRNHKWFLLFLITYIIFLIVLTVEASRHMMEVWLNEEAPIWTDYAWSAAVIVLVTINIPVVSYQCWSQWRSITGRPIITKQDYQKMLSDAKSQRSSNYGTVMSMQAMQPQRNCWRNTKQILNHKMQT